MSSLVVRGYSPQECLNDTKAVASKFAGAVSDAASAVGTWTYNNGSRVVVWLKDNGTSALLWVKEGSKDAYYWTKDCGAGAVSWTKESGGQVYNWMKGNASSVYNLAKDGVNSVHQHFIYVAQAIKEGAVTLITWSLHTISSVYEQAKPHLIAFARDAKQTASDAYQTVRGFIQAHPNEMIIGITAFCLGVLITLALQRVYGSPTAHHHHYAPGHAVPAAAAAGAPGPHYAPGAGARPLAGGP